MAKRLDSNDIKNAQMLKAVVAQGKFEVKGDAIKQVASLLIWMESLPDMIQETLKPVEEIKIEAKEEVKEDKKKK